MLDALLGGHCFLLHLSYLMHLSLRPSAIACREWNAPSPQKNKKLRVIPKKNKKLRVIPNLFFLGANLCQKPPCQKNARVGGVWVCMCACKCAHASETCVCACTCCFFNEAAVCAVPGKSDEFPDALELPDEFPDPDELPDQMSFQQLSQV